MGAPAALQGAIGRVVADGRHAAEITVDAVGWGVERSARPLFGLLRRYSPIASTDSLATVTHAADVREVLEDHVHFGVPYGAKMQAIPGPFILGLDDTPLSRHDHAALREAMRHQDVADVGASMLAAARVRVSKAGDRIDVVSELADPAIDAVASSYLGVPGPDHETQLRWTRNLFEDIFINVTDLSSVHERALADAAEMRPYVDRLIAARKAQIVAGAEVADDVLTRLLGRQSSDGGLHDIA